MRLSTLRPLYDVEGPWVSAYIDASRDTEDARDVLDLRSRALWTQVEGKIPESSKEAIDRALAGDRTPGRHGLAVFARDGNVALAEPFPSPPAVPAAAVDAVPHVLPLLEQQGEHVAWLQVVLDRTGGDITAASAGHTPRETEVTGPESYPMTKSKPGGWSTPRYQRAVEVTWQRNAGEVAHLAADMAQRTGAEVLVVAGDERARQLFVEQLPAQWQERVVHSDSGSRALGADPQGLNEATERAITAVAAARLHDAIENYGLQSGHDLTAGGLPGAITALQRGMADTILMAPGELGDQQLWIGPEGQQLALDARELDELGVTERHQVPAAEALIRAACCTGAELFLVEPAAADLSDGVGALLRGPISPAQAA